MEWHIEALQSTQGDQITTTLHSIIQLLLLTQHFNSLREILHRWGKN
uniref:Uncharacterized protein n=1 Tax=Arundo donax TaxID=35708 RepID=A0A0A9A922_ARUDO